MSLRDEARDEMRSTKRPCVVCEARASLSDKLRAELDECMTDTSLTGTAIARVLRRHGFEQINEDGKQVREHRRRCMT